MKSAISSAIVIGAGPAGLSAAYWLSRHGVRTTLVERALEVRRGGIAIDLRGAAIAVAQQMEIWDGVLACRTHLQTMVIHRQGDRSSLKVDLSSVPRDTSEQVELFRGDLVGLLLDRLPDEVELLCGERLCEVEQGEQGVEVVFESGRRLQGDLLIGADGQRSNVRRRIGLDAPLLHLGAWAAVYSMKNKLGVEDTVETYNTPGRLLTMFTTPNNEELVVGLLYRGAEDFMEERPISERLRQVFADYGHRTPELLNSLPDGDALYFDSVSQVKIPRWSKQGRVVVLGDAAWGPSLLSGQGTSLAMVGAYILVQELSLRSDVGAALHGFETRMRPFVQVNQELADVGLGVVLPNSRFAIAARNQLMRFAPLLARLSARLDQKVLRAANAIELEGPPSV